MRNISKAKITDETKIKAAKIFDILSYCKRISQNKRQKWNTNGIVKKPD